MVEIPPEDQIEFLLSTGRIKEAKDTNFQNRLKQFNMDAGWVYLINPLDFENVIANFK